MKWYNIGVVRRELSTWHSGFDEEIKLLNRLGNYSVNLCL